MNVGKGRQGQAEGYLSGRGRPKAAAAVPNAERRRKVHSFTLGDAADGALAKLTQIYDDNASAIVERALAEMLERASGSPGASGAGAP